MRSWCVAAGTAAMVLVCGCNQQKSGQANNQQKSDKATATDEYQQAEKAQADARRKLDDLKQAQKKVADQRQDVTKAQEQLQTAQQQAQQAIQRASQEAQQAHQAGQQTEQQRIAQAQTAQQQATQRDQQMQQQQQNAQQPNAQQENAQNANAQPEPATGSASIERVTGKVVSATQDQVVVARDTGAAVTVGVEDTTSTTIDGTPASVSALQPGARVDVAYRRNGNRLVAQRIDGRTTM